MEAWGAEDEAEEQTSVERRSGLSYLRNPRASCILQATGSCPRPLAGDAGKSMLISLLLCACLFVVIGMLLPSRPLFCEIHKNQDMYARAATDMMAMGHGSDGTRHRNFARIGPVTRQRKRSLSDSGTLQRTMLQRGHDILSWLHAQALQRPIVFVSPADCAEIPLTLII